MNNLSKFSDTLNELITLNNLTEISLAEKTGIPVSCISLYLNGKQLPYIDTAVKIADYFNCSMDYLLGLSDNVNEKKYLPCPPFAERFSYLVENNKMDSCRLYELAGVPKSSFYEWKRGKSKPTIDYLVKLSQVLGVSIDYILGREN